MSTAIRKKKKYSSSSRNRRMKGTDVVGAFTTIAIMTGVTVAGVVVWKIYKKLEGDPNAAATVDAYSQQATDLQSGGMTPTYSDNIYQSTADSIFEDIRHSHPFSWFGDSQFDDVVTEIEKMKNDLDIAKLIKAFGIRERDYFGVIPDGSDKNLPTFVTELLGPERISQLNDYFASQGMNFTF